MSVLVALLATLSASPAIAAKRPVIDNPERIYVAARAAELSGDHGRSAMLLTQLAEASADDSSLSRRAASQAINAGAMGLALRLGREIPADNLTTDVRLLLAADELLSRAYGHCLVHHARLAPTPVGREPAAVARVKSLLAARYGEDLPLAVLAAEAHLSPHHLIRAFRRETGLTPHAWLMSVRVERAKILLRRGEAPADVATATGFCDQPHLTRVFKARVGVTPGVYRAAAAA